MKRSKKPLTYAALVAGIGALSMAVEGCVYGPPQDEVCVYGPAPDTEVTSELEEDESTSSEENTVTTVSDTDETQSIGGSETSVNATTVPDETQSIDGDEVDVYGPAPDDGI